MKCDEAKPSCNRCLKWSGVCGGYEVRRSNSCPPKSTSATRVGTRSLSSRPHTRCEPTSPATSSPDDSVASPSVGGSTPAAAAFLYSKQTLDYFSEQQDMFSGGASIVENISMPFTYSDTPAVHKASELGILDATFWTDTVPRLVRDNLAVRYANMAVHILILSKQPELLAQESADLGGANHYSLALAHYGLALQQMRHASAMRGGIRAAVLCSMFFVVFEALNGDRDAAEAHLRCGQRLLHELQHLLPSGVAASGAGSLRRELRNLLQYIALQVRIGGVTCWKGEFDTQCAEYLEQFAAGDEPYRDSPGHGMPGGYTSMMWPEDDAVPAIHLEDFTF